MAELISVALEQDSCIQPSELSVPLETVIITESYWEGD